jgi:hypothetical protein
VFKTHCANLSKSTAPLSHKEQALLNFVYDSAKMESEWLEWRSRIVIGGRRDGQRHAFEKTIGLHFEKDEYGNNKKQFNKKENMWEPITEPIIVHEHFNSPYFKRINENPDEFDPVNIANAYENENYHKELMFMERQLLKMKLFNAADSEKLEKVKKELDKAWDEKEYDIRKIDAEYNSIFSWYQRTFNHDQYEQNINAKKLQYISEHSAYEKQYRDTNRDVFKNATLAKQAEERLEQEIQSFKNPRNRRYIAHSCIVKKVNFNNLQNARDLYLKE